jgi:hypothetical protein
MQTVEPYFTRCREKYGAIMRDEPTIVQKEISMNGSGDPPTPYSRLHQSRATDTPFANKVFSCDVVSFSQSIIFCAFS